LVGAVRTDIPLLEWSNSGGTVNYFFAYHTFLATRGAAMGWIANIVAGLIGAWIGQGLLGTWGPSLAGMALIPSIIGAIILVLIVSLVVGRTSKK
jgi:uncharacterized membrane protein YeaQ/YmgE (transglycosylase-associated protein family)